MLGREQNPLRTVLTVQEFPGHTAASPADDPLRLLFDRFEAFTNQCRNDVRRLEIEIVPGTIKVDRQQEDRIVSVLLTVRLRLDKHHLLRQPIWGVGLFRITVPDILFPEWHGRELGISADCAEPDKLWYIPAPCFIEQLDSHHQVVVEITAGIGPIRPDTPNNRCHVNYHIRICVVVKSTHLLDLHQIVVTASWDENILDPALPKFSCHIRTKEARAPGHNYAFVWKIAHD